MAVTSIVERAPSDVFQTIQQRGLTKLYNFINGSTQLTNLLSSAQEFTFLAPTDDAFETWLTSEGNVTDDVIEATLSYHIFNGSFPTIDFTSTSQFVPTYLQNSSYSNITITPPGQRVELIEGTDGTPEILSNNKTVTSITTKV